MAELFIESQSGQSDLLNTAYSSEVTWGSAIPKGMIAPFGRTAPPEGWLICDGSTLNALQDVMYRSLFDAIGTTWGGTGESNFQIPDLRGTFLRGSGSQTYDSKSYDGGSVSSQSKDALEEHQHEIRTINQAGATYASSAAGGASFGQWNAHPAKTQPLESGDETKPFNTSVLYCIKY